MKRIGYSHILYSVSYRRDSMLAHIDIAGSVILIHNFFWDISENKPPAFSPAIIKKVSIQNYSSLSRGSSIAQILTIGGTVSTGSLDPHADSDSDSDAIQLERLWVFHCNFEARHSQSSDR
jgi:hypothetical protein